MNPRTMILTTALILVGIGLATTLWGLFRPDAPPATPIAVLVAAQQIEPYTIITTDMLQSGGVLAPSRAAELGAWPNSAAVGKMSAGLIKVGQILTAVNAKPIEAVRLAADLDLEIVSFQAGVDRLVGGQIRPGHLINVYGFGRDEATRENFTRLIDSRVWVVEVSQSGRQLDLPTPRPDLTSGDYGEEPARAGGSNATLITVAVEPRRAANLIDALGADGLQVWVTLAANDVARYSTATPLPKATATALPATPWYPPGWDPTPDWMPPTGYGGMAGR
ncbi:MAG TPA: hypothetical protein PK826_15895 [Anaerolineae bacterium]|nr:hypothetical protein [Anaerolineae bacterium]